jgi:iron complex outermembrane receptor protein
LNVNAGITGEGDGGTYALNFNSGSNIGKGGFINYSFGVRQQNNAIRSGTIDVPTEIVTFSDGSPEVDQNIQDFLAINPTGGNLNGTGEISAANFEYNFGVPVGEHGQFYSNAAMVFKKVISNANYRVPYWKVDYGLLHVTDPNGVNYTNNFTTDVNGEELYKGYLGYMPTFEGDLKDYNATLGYKNELNGWVTDVSLTLGGNQQTYTVNNTVNHSLGAAGPTSYKPGGYNFRHVVGNFDISKSITDNITVALGTEVRSETYQIIAGDTASYSGEGANSFPGIRAENATTNSRFNLGAYLDVAWDITENFLIAGAVRTENYSDFGSANVGKISTRLKLMDDKIVLRGSYSSGFRAPTLHQIYAQSTQASFVGGTIALSGLFNNISKEAYLLGIPKLKPEKSTNFTIGTGLNLTKDFSLTVDYYDITIKDRIVYSSSIPTENLPVDLDVVNVQFFLNGIETQTRGLDVVASYKNLAVGAGTIGVNFAANFTLSNEIKGEPAVPPVIADAGEEIMNAQVKSLITEGRPKYKAILGIDYSLNKFNVVLNNTLFGPTSFQDLDNDGDWYDSRMDMNNMKQTFSPAVVTDLNVGYAFTKNISLSLSVNNLFNVLPKWKLEALNSDGEEVLNDAELKSLMEGFISFSGRYRILGYNGSQFSQLGTTFMGQLTFKF